ncbi:tail fiber domain-containing protein [Burkholderia pyrrocinia]|uniref:tail fiber domain-containing protein n=1 Tax=Burkholderia pyrrocinia TaxID=60550 RepID=UPI001BCF3592|nr:tail fiber domain-containing protein [Burkholderia pyrrocinia]QVN18763.1 tail fiber domain-containing protein [Burkholderia pyrrocinia]
MTTIIGTLPSTLQNGTTADASQVMTILNFIVNQVNANAQAAGSYAQLSGAAFTGPISVSVTGSSFTGRNLFNINGAGQGEVGLQNTTGSYFYMRGRSASGGMEWVNNAYSAVVAFMDDGGNFTATGLTASSDRRLKSHVKRIRSATEVVLAWVGVTFQRKGDKTKRRHAGFVADDMMESAPELIFEDERGFKSIAYGNASAYLAVAFQELEARVRKLESKK